MAQEDKELLLADICGRLPYEVKCETTVKNSIIANCTVESIRRNENGDLFVELIERGADGNSLSFVVADFDYVKPYLRPMSSMTEEELYEVQEILGKGVEIREDFILSVDSSIDSFSYLELIAVFEWFNAHHFDYRGLIEKGLALEALEGMYN